MHQTLLVLFCDCSLFAYVTRESGTTRQVLPYPLRTDGTDRLTGRNELSDEME
jgi:hypothetical protein